jgi:hypothetical protein
MLLMKGVANGLLALSPRGFAGLGDMTTSVPLAGFSC